MVKIALVVYQFIKEKGGVERYVSNLADHLLARNFDVHIFAHKFGEDQDKRLKYHYVPSITFWSPLKYWTFAVNAPRVIKNTGIPFDLVHGFTQTLYQDIYRVGGGSHWEFMTYTYPWMKYTIGNIVLRLNPRHASLLYLERFIFKRKCYKQITCISEKCKNEIITHYHIPAEDIEVIYNGVDIKFFTPENRSKYRNSVRNKYKIKPEEILLVFVGSGFKRKGLVHVIHVLSLLKNVERFKLLVVGKGDEKKYISISREKGISENIIFTGASKHVQQIYAAGDIFVFPSEYDAFGTACLEAMASGLPVIVSKASGASEIIDYGQEGFVIGHPIDAKELADCLCLLLDEEKRKIIGQAARRKSEKYSFEANVEETIRVYQNITDIQGKLW